MSAIAGRWNFDGRPDTDRDCADMLRVQAIYGPHDTARWNAGTIALGRNLYRTLPEDIHDAQPLSGGGGRFVMVADVRLDYREELVATLGLAPGGLADSALLMAAWERWQDGCFVHIVGDYAFAVFDRAEQRLTLARDPLGSRPLHYHRGRGFFAFASMPKGLHALADVPRAPDEETVAEHLALLPESGTRTFFKDVERVESGGVAVVTPSGLTARRHWHPVRRDLKLAGADAYAEGLRHHLDAAVRVRLRGAGAAVGSHLSSGFDSSAVTTSAALQMAALPGKVVAFTSVPREGYDGRTPRARPGDEGPIAAMTAARYPNIEHVLIRTAGRSPLDSLDRNVFFFERPVLNLCNGIWANAINDAAQARGLTVLLPGQMGNMSVSYDGLTLLPELVQRGRLLRLLREGTALVRTGQMRVRNVLAQSFGPFMPAFLWNGISRVFRGVEAGPQSYSAIRDEALAGLDLARRAAERDLDLIYRPRRDGFETRLWTLRRVDMGNYLKGTLGGWGLDHRDPTADRRLLEFCLSIPDEQFLSRGETKALARRALADRLPREVVAMRGKGYQAADWHETLASVRPDLAAELDRLEGCTPAANAIDVPRLKTLVRDWPSGGWETERVIRQYRLALLRGISAGHFVRRASSSNM